MDYMEPYRALVNGHLGVKGTSYGNNLVTQPTTVKIKLKKNNTERYCAYAKFQVELCKSNDWSATGPWFLEPSLVDNPVWAPLVKRGLLSQVNRHPEVYNLVFKYVYDRCLETTDSKTVAVEFGRKSQPVSTDLLATGPFPVETLWAYVHFPESLRNKLNDWLNCSFKVTLSHDPITVHSYFGETTETPCWDDGKPRCASETRFDWDTRWLVERLFSNGPAVKYKDFMFPFHVELNYSGFHPDVFMPDYFTTVKPRPWTGEVVQVFNSSGDVCYCVLAALKSSSQMFEAHFRWNNENLTLELPNEVFEPFIEFINYSHITAATNSFKLAVELLFAANKYDVKELQDKLLDLIYVLPVLAFDDTEALVELYFLLEVTRMSDCVLQRIEGIVKLEAKSIMSSQFYKELNPTHQSNILCIVNSYDVVLDIMSLWTDNKHATRCAIEYEALEAQIAENIRIQAIHKRKPWQLCCDYLNYCNFKTGNEAPTSEIPERLIKIQKTYNFSPLYPCTFELTEEMAFGHSAFFL